MHSPENDPRLRLYLSPVSTEVFHGVAHAYDVWRADAYDVPEIHQHARELFAELVNQARQRSLGRILLLLGESGAGKTHLMRAYRNYVHGSDAAFFGYMPMTSSARRYDHYVLQKLIESLQQPYNAPAIEASSLQLLSDALAEQLPAERRASLTELDEGSSADGIIDELADELFDLLDMPDLDLDLCRVLLLLQVDRASVTRRVTKYLRAEPLSAHDLSVLGNMAPRSKEVAPIEVIRQLSALIHRTMGRALVVCADQLEDILDLDDPTGRYGQAMDVLKTLADLPGTVVVVCCLDAFYAHIKQSLKHSVIQRLEQDPAPLTLIATRSQDEVDKLVSQRLKILYQQHEVDHDPQQPRFPLTTKHIEAWSGQTTRRALNDCLQYRERAIAQGRLPDLSGGVVDLSEGGGGTVPPPEVRTLQQQWNDFKSGEHEVPDEEPALLAILDDTITACGEELTPGRFTVTRRDKGMDVVPTGFEGDHDPLFVALCDKDPRGGGLAKQLEHALKAAKRSIPVVTRSAPFSRNTNSQAGNALGQVLVAGGRRVVVEDTDWRHMIAMQRFRADYRAAPGFDAFVQEERPLSRLPSLRAMLALDAFDDAPPVAHPPETEPDGLPPTTRPPSPPPPPDPPPQPPPSTGEAEGGGRARPPQVPRQELTLGHTMGLQPKEVSFDPAWLTRHITFMGGTGSGKTTSAMMVLEQLLSQGVPAIVVDRKGDLCSYGDPNVWLRSVGDPEVDAFREQLRDRVDVAVFTPGHPEGRGLEVPIVPRGIRTLSPHAREMAVRVASDALANSLDYGKGVTDRRKRTALQVALKVLVEQGSDDTLTLPTLLDVLRSNDPALTEALQEFAPFAAKVAMDLQGLRLTKGALMGAGCEPLDAALLLGTDGSVPAGKTRLCVISTKFLGSFANVQFWVTQLLLEVDRWMNANPADHLQAMLMLDEADIYLPARSEPPTKEQLMGLLRRARSAGLGVMLATQSPGDLDYKGRDNIRTWLVGRLQQTTAIAKLRELLSESHTDGSQLATQKIGEFHLLAEGRTIRMKSRRNAVSLDAQLADDQILAVAARRRPTS